MIEAQRERRLTVEEYERIAPLLDGPSELINGRLHLMSPTSSQHGYVTAELAMHLGVYVRSFTPRTGLVFGAETGFRVSEVPATVIAPDVAYMTIARFKAQSSPVSRETNPREHFVNGAPDLAVEVLSPSDSMRKMLAKARQWLEAGTLEVWLVDCQREQVRVLRGNAGTKVFTRQQSLISPELLPGFTLALDDLFSWFETP